MSDLKSAYVATDVASWWVGWVVGYFYDCCEVFLPSENSSLLFFIHCQFVNFVCSILNFCTKPVHNFHCARNS